MIKKLQDMNILNKFVNKNDVIFRGTSPFFSDNLAPLLLSTNLFTNNSFVNFCFKVKAEINP